MLSQADMILNLDNQTIDISNKTLKEAVNDHSEYEMGVIKQVKFKSLNWCNKSDF